jgi:tetratricopeptide (TPR) repeat protein
MSLLLVLALLVPTPRQDSVRVNATLKTSRIVAGESTVLEIRVETSGVTPDAIRMPPLPAGLDIIGETDVTYDQINFPGGRTRLTSRDIVLTSRVPGTFMIPGISVVVAGRTYRTRPIALVVHTAPRTRAPPGIISGVQLNARIQPARAWVGQQVTFSAEAVFPRELRQRQTRPATYQPPNPPGFWSQDLADQMVIGLRSVGDEIFETQTFRRAYFPITAGTHVFPPAKLGYEYRPGAGLPPESRELRSDSLRLVVMPLPEAGRPASFTGAVGQFRLRASLEPVRADVGEAVELVVEVIGRGNIKALPSPRLPEIASAEVFPPTESAEPQVGTEFVSGTKTFRWVLVPKEPGEITIPAIAYGYFDANAAKYAEAAAQPLHLTVSGPATPLEGQITLRPVKPSPSSDALGVVRSPLFLAAQLLPLALLVASWMATRRREAPVEPRRAASARAALAELRPVAAGDPREFCGRLAVAVRAQIADLYHDGQLRTSSPAVVRQTLETAGTARPTAAALADLLETLDRVRFARGESLPDPAVMMQRAEQLLDALASRSRGAGPNAGIVALALGAAAANVHAVSSARTLALPASNVVQAVTPFDRGVQLMLRSRFDAATAEFETHLARNPRDANAWYNAGNAYYYSGRPGEAVHAWITAVRLNPRHAEARGNLTAAAPASSPLLPPALSLAGDEAGALLAAVWWIGAGLVAFRLRRKKRPGLTALVFAALGLVVILAGVAGRAVAEAAVITAPASTVHSDPVLKGEAVEELAAGTPVTVLARRPGWLRVRTPAGREGWIESGQLIEV